MINILDPQVRRQLEQERNRLTQERDRLVKQAISQVEDEFESAIANLNSLLDGSSSSSKKAAAAAPKVATATRGRKAAAGTGKRGPKAAAAPKAPKATAAKSGRGIAKAKGKKAGGAAAASSGAFSVQALKPEFEGMEAIDAIVKVVKASPKKVFTTEDILDAVYPPIPEGEVTNARKSVGVVLSWATRRGAVVRVQKNPATFQAKK
jgi:hypothetical protein